MSRLGRLRAALGAAVVVLLVAGCAQLPTSGPVRAGLPDAPAAGTIRYDASRPSPGTQPTALVQGFLQAGAAGLSGDGDFEVARSFLTGASASQWEPLSQVLVAANDAPQTLRAVLPIGDAASTGPASPSAGGGSGEASGAQDEDSGREPSAEELAAANRVSVVVELVAVGGLDSRGAYVPELERAASELEFGLVRVDGEWRIESLPPGLLLTEGTFATVFRAVPLAFLSPDADVIVPDVRFVPTRRAARYAVDQLLAGPVDWLSEAVATAIPEGLQVDSARGVVVDEATGNAEVFLTAADVGPGAADLVYAQLQQTLLGIPSVWSVTVWFGPTPYEPAGDVRLPEPAPAVGNTMVAISQDRLVTITGETVTDQAGFAALQERDASGREGGPGAGEGEQADPGQDPGAESGSDEDAGGQGEAAEPGASEDTAPAPEPEAATQPAPDAVAGAPAPGLDLSAWRGPTLGYGTEPDVAVVADAELVVLTHGGERLVLAEGPDLLAPSVDRFGWVWSGTRGAVLAALPGAQEVLEVPVAAEPDGVDAGGVTAIRISRDGARALVTQEIGERQVLSVHGVLRGRAGAPIGLGAGVPLGAFQTLVRAVWADAATVVTLGSATEDGPMAVRTGAPSGPMSSLSATPQPIWVAAGDGVSQIFVAAADGRLMARASTRGWAAVADAIVDPSFPG